MNVDVIIDDVRVRGFGKSFDSLGPSVFTEAKGLSFQPVSGVPSDGAKCSATTSVYYESIGRSDVPVFLLERLAAGDIVQGPGASFLNPSHSIGSLIHSFASNDHRRHADDRRRPDRDGQDHVQARPDRAGGVSGYKGVGLNIVCNNVCLGDLRPLRENADFSRLEKLGPARVARTDPGVDERVDSAPRRALARERRSLDEAARAPDADLRDALRRDFDV
mgnify:CR=1 FL=1